MKPNYMNHISIPLLKVFVLLLPACLLLNACKVLVNQPLSFTEAKAAQKKLPHYYIIDNEHVLTEVWSVYHIAFNNNEITSRVIKVPWPQSEEVVQFKSKFDYYERKNNIYLFAKPELANKLQHNECVTFDYHELDHISVLEKDYEKTATRRSPLLAGFYLGVIFIYIVVSFFQGG